MCRKISHNRNKIFIKQDKNFKLYNNVKTIRILNTKQSHRRQTDGWTDGLNRQQVEHTA